MPRSRKSKTRKPPVENPGSASGSTTPELGVKWGEPLDSEKVSVSFDMTVMATPDEVKATKPSSEPTSSASSTTETSWPRTADKLAVASYLPGEPLRLRPEHLPRLNVLAVGLGVSVDAVVERILTVLTNSRANWGEQTVSDLVEFYLANYYYE